MLIVDGELALLAGYIDHKLCEVNPAFTKIPQEDRNLAAFWSMRANMIAFIEVVPKTKRTDPKVAVVLLSSRAWNIQVPSFAYPLRVIEGWKPKLIPALKPYGRAMENLVSSGDGLFDLISHFRDILAPVTRQVDKGEAQIVGWNDQGRLLISGTAPQADGLPIQTN